MPRMTTQAIALTHAYRTSGAPLTTRHGRKAYSIKTERKWHTYHNPRTGERQRFFEYGDAVLHADSMPHDEAVRVAKHIAACGYHAVVFPHSTDDTASVMATTDYRRSGEVAVYDRSFDYRNITDIRVPEDEALRRACGERADAVGG